MHQKKLKYSVYLRQFSNCPPRDFQEEERMAFRWVHASEHPNDFLPVNLINPTRVLDNSDLICMGYGLSMFDSHTGACTKYVALWKRRRAHLQVQMETDLGRHVAQLALMGSDGVSGPVYNHGHFTFHEYEGVELSSRIVELMDIFDGDGKSNC
jgi:hypothetical protein